jgi:hypothetical protein
VTDPVVAKLQEIADQYPASIFTSEGRTSDGIAGTAIRERMLGEIRRLQEELAEGSVDAWKCWDCRSLLSATWRRCPYCVGTGGV